MANETYAYPRRFENLTAAASGMTLRDYFAGQAIAHLGLRKDMLLRNAEHIAALSYELADALLAAREVKP